MKKLLPLLFLSLLFSKRDFAQTIYAGLDTTICDGTNATLVASYIPQAAIVFDPDTDAYTTGTLVQNMDIDDQYSEVLPIGFDFCYFGNIYNRLLISTNNYITFDTSDASGYSPWQTLALPDATAPLNAIMGPWQDINPALGGSITYKVYGVAPNRHLTISWYQIPMYSCTSILYTSQLKLYESSGIIESHILDRQICATWPLTGTPGVAVHGLHNIDGTLADIVPGRNNTAWAINNEGYRWTPQGANPLIEWYDMSGNLLATNDSLNVSPTTTSSYICKLLGNSCSGPFEKSDTVTVNVVPSADASFTYSSSTFCPSGGINPIAIPGAGTTGTYSASPAGVVFVSTNTGEINIATSTPGSYTITRADTATVCRSIVTFPITITNTPNADHSYAASAYCANAVSTSPNFIGGGSGGIFSATPAGLVFINTSSGEVDLAASTAGTYTITNTINAVGCPVATDTSILVIAPQSIDAGAPITLCSGSNATLLGTAIGPNSANVTWSGGAGVFTNINNDTTVYTPSVNEINLGTIILQITTNGTTNCPSITDNVTLTIDPGATADAGFDQNICGTVANLFGDIGGLTTTGTWSTNGTGTFSPNPNDLFASYTASSADLINGSVVLYLTSDVPASGSCPSAVDSITVSFTTQPTLTTSVPSTICGGQNVTLNLTSTATGTINSYQWTSSGTGTFSSTSTANTQYTLSNADITAGSITFTLNGIAPFPCGNIVSTGTTQIIAPPTATVSGGGIVQRGPKTICPNGTDADVTIVLFGTGPFAFTYTVGGDTLNVLNATSPYIYQDSIYGTFKVISVSNASGCAGLINGSAFVDTVNISYQTLPQNETCGESDGSARVIKVSGGDAPYSYLWNPTNVTDSISSNLTAGTYYVTVTDVNGCFAEDTVIVPQVLGIVASITADPMTGLYPLSVNFTNNSTGATSYNWNFGDSISSTDAAPSHVFQSQGSYQVVLTAYNTPQCSISDTLTIVVDGEVANVFTPNGDDKNDKFSFNQLSVKTFNAQIFNRWGKKVYEWSDPKEGWDGGDAAAGIYYYIVVMTTLADKTEELHGTITLMK